jgi:hypothetical protein
VTRNQSAARAAISLAPRFNSGAFANVPGLHGTPARIGDPCLGAPLRSRTGPAKSLEPPTLVAWRPREDIQLLQFAPVIIDMKSRKKQEAEPKSWLTYEEVAAYLLNRFAKEFGLKFVEGKQKILGSITTWEIDAKGVPGDEGFFIVECRRCKKKQTQAQVGGLAFSIIDTGAAGGIIVSPVGLQKGAQKIATAKNIVSVRLTADSTPTEFAIQFLNKLCLGIRGKATANAIVTPRYLRECLKCSKKFEVSGDRLLCRDCANRESAPTS